MAGIDGLAVAFFCWSAGEDIIGCTSGLQEKFIVRLAQENTIIQV